MRRRVPTLKERILSADANGLGTIAKAGKTELELVRAEVERRIDRYATRLREKAGVQ